jgi:carbon monoxide dehydrogenase subunit G
MTGEVRIDAPRETVWKNLNDPEVLKQSITGCDELEQNEENQFTAKVTAKVGPVKAKFSGVVRLSDLNPPSSYKISGEGKGGAAGFAKGGAEVSLEEDGAGTLLKYSVSASVGGKLAQLGGRLIDSTAKKYSDEFFAKFKEFTESGGTTDASGETSGIPDAAAEDAAAIATPSDNGPERKMGTAIWIILLIIIVAAAAAYFGMK